MKGKAKPDSRAVEREKTARALKCREAMEKVLQRYNCGFSPRPTLVSAGANGWVIGTAVDIVAK